MSNFQSSVGAHGPATAGRSLYPSAASAWKPTRYFMNRMFRPWTMPARPKVVLPRDDDAFDDLAG